MGKKILAKLAKMEDNEDSNSESDDDDIQSVEASELGTIADESDYELDANFDDFSDDDMDANGHSLPKPIPINGEHSQADIKKKLDDALAEEEELPTDPKILAQELRSTKKALEKAEGELLK